MSFNLKNEYIAKPYYFCGFYAFFKTGLGERHFIFIKGMPV